MFTVLTRVTEQYDLSVASRPREAITSLIDGAGYRFASSDGD